ncbi:MAG: hypothetical protein KDI88_02505 [Gammaproteobacteria bacterium]|nr:hypothetical protein [Gammaproteobacteria bacterium]
MTSTRGPCRFCRTVRTGLLSLLLGATTGYIAVWSGAGTDAGMLATFVAAVVPWLWWARRNRLSS